MGNRGIGFCGEAVVTDFRRPDLDLWEEEDPDDARPTIVAERPGESRAAAPGSERRSNPGRSSLMQRLIERGELEAEPDAAAAAEEGRPTAERLRDSEVDRMRVADSELEEPTLQVSRSELEETEELDAEPLELLVERDSRELDNEPTRVAPAPRPVPPPPPLARAANSEREVTERISVTGMTGMAGSIAPATKSVRPPERERRGMAWWQGALAAAALLGGGFWLLQARRSSMEAVTVGVSQPQRAETEPGPLVEPTPTVAEPPVAEAMPSAEPRPVEPQQAQAMAAEPAEPQRAEPAAQQAQPAESQQAEPQKAPPEVQASKAAPAEPQPSASGASVDAEALEAERRARAERRAARARAEPAYEPPKEAAQTAPSEPVQPAAPSGSRAGLPERPTRDQVAAALNAVLPDLQKCVGDRHDTAEVTLTVRSGGFVSYAIVTGAYAGSPEGSCIARSVKNAKFPPFRDDSLRVTYPFQL